MILSVAYAVFWLLPKPLAAQQAIPVPSEESAIWQVLTQADSTGWMYFLPEEGPSPEVFWETYAAELFLAEGEEALLKKEETDELGITHLRYAQLHHGYPVEGTDLSLHTRENRVLQAHGKWAQHLEIPLTVVLSETEAIHLAVERVAAERYAWEDSLHEALWQEQMEDPEATHFPEGELRISRRYEVLAGEEVAETHRLTWYVEVHALESAESWGIYLDAATGEVFAQRSLSRHCSPVSGTCNTLYNGARSFLIDQNGSDFILDDNIRKMAVWKSGAINQSITNSSANWGNNEQESTSALWSMQQIYDYININHGWKGFNNGSLTAFAVTGSNQSRYDGFNRIYFRGQSGSQASEVTLDIVGHEWMHGVAFFTANLNPEREPGAVGEAYSDIFGTLAERYGLYGSGWNWTMGENTGTITRNLQNPLSEGYPNVVWGGNYFNPSSANCPTPSDANDHCGVHQNSTITGLCFYLLSQGGSQNGGIVVPSIGIDKAAKIAFRALRYYLQSNSGFADTRLAWIQAAQSLYGTCSLEEFACQRAWAAVGVGSSPNTHCVTISGPSYFCYDSHLPTYTAKTVSGATLNWTIPSGWTVQFSGNDNQFATVTNIAPWAYQFSNVTLSLMLRTKSSKFLQGKDISI